MICFQYNRLKYHTIMNHVIIWQNSSSFFLKKKKNTTLNYFSWIERNGSHLNSPFKFLRIAVFPPNAILNHSFFFSPDVYPCISWFESPFLFILSISNISIIFLKIFCHSIYHEYDSNVDHPFENRAAINFFSVHFLLSWDLELFSNPKRF